MPCGCAPSASRPSTRSCGSPALSFSDAGLPQAALLESWKGLRLEMVRGEGSGDDTDSIPTDSFVSVRVPGDPFVLYDLQLRLRAVIECVQVTGGQSELIGESSAGLEVFSATNSSVPLAGNTLRLLTTAPVVNRIINVQQGEDEVSDIQSLDLTFSIQARGGSKISLLNHNSLGEQKSNSGPDGAYVRVAGVAPFPSVFNGQFIQVDLVNICPALAAKAIAGPDTFHLPPALRFPQNLQFTNGVYSDSVQIIFRLVGGDPGTYRVGHNVPFRVTNSFVPILWWMRINQDGSIERLDGSTWTPATDYAVTYVANYIATDGEGGQFSPITRSFFDLALSATVVEDPEGVHVTSYSNVGRINVLSSLDHVPGTFYNDTTPTPRVINFALFKRDIIVVQD